MFAIFSYLLSGDECKAVIKTLESKSPAITPSNGQYQTGFPAGKWRESEDGQKIQDRATTRGMLTFLIVVIPCGFLFTYTEKLGAKKKNE